ncbi:hypothetical protein [Planobispora longispora]|uniref:Uncharacterized protein n=1 Tax=Planobispora longispora TaxID=28887 RepID=A0A8J3RTF4_9ACTN|nr:hypothetical protein [Planobispora longispora]GIH79269.1 hypothetical protein Plo01_56980 [Planobispora longispora]
MAQAGFDRAAGVAGTYLASPFARWRDFGEYRRALDGEAAVRLAQNSCAELDHDRPGDWPAWERLTPHIAAMVTSLASHLDLEDLGSLLGLSHGAFFSMGGVGRQATPDGEALARATMTAARRLGDEQFHRELLADMARALGVETPVRSFASSRSVATGSARYGQTVEDHGRPAAAAVAFKQARECREAYAERDRSHRFPGRFRCSRAEGRFVHEPALMVSVSTRPLNSSAGRRRRSPLWRP